MKRKNPRHLVPYYMLAASFLFAVLPVLSGCGNTYTGRYNNLGLVEVNGVVTLDGQPLPDAQVHFEHENKTYSYGVTNEYGKYQLHFNSQKTGVLPGSKTVRIWTTRKGLDSEQLTQEINTAKEQERIPDQYNQKSTLTVTVETGKSQTFDFDLKSGK
ncbi:MAG: carboxypeptidase-like regulatory domain-containing protein [Planctomycetaceae bacterium]|jgi:hypothetical protein|nr:carboxypeptidase-like regulatory domain-containing protein [Planctomycetaceae bacterium]